MGHGRIVARSRGMGREGGWDGRKRVKSRRIKRKGGVMNMKKEKRVKGGW